MFSYGLLHMDTPVLANPAKIYIHQLCPDTGCYSRAVWLNVVECVPLTPRTMVNF